MVNGIDEKRCRISLEWRERVERWEHVQYSAEKHVEHHSQGMQTRTRIRTKRKLRKKKKVWKLNGHLIDPYDYRMY
jgi:hypothetical protein